MKELNKLKLNENWGSLVKLIVAVIDVKYEMENCEGKNIADYNIKYILERVNKELGRQPA